MRLSDVACTDVQDLAERLTAAGLSASTVQNTLDLLRVILPRAIRSDLMVVDPTDNSELRQPKGRRERIATPAEAVALLDALRDLEQALWATAFYTGMRRGELRALLWSDVDLSARRIRVRRGWDDEEGAQDGKSVAAERTLPILPARTDPRRPQAPHGPRRRCARPRAHRRQAALPVHRPPSGARGVEGSVRAPGSRGARLGADRASRGPPHLRERPDRVRR